MLCDGNLLNIIERVLELGNYSLLYTVNSLMFAGINLYILKTMFAGLIFAVSSGLFTYLGT